YPCSVDINRVIVRAKIFHCAPHDLKLAVVRTLESQFWRKRGLWQVTENLCEASTRLADNFQQPEGGIDRIVKTIIAIVEEHMAAHLACQRGVFFLQLALD